MTSDSGFLTLVKISAFSRLGIHTGLRWFLQILLDTFLYINLPPRLLEILKKNCKKTLHFLFFLAYYMCKRKGRTNRAGRIGESGDCSLWMLDIICGL